MGAGRESAKKIFEDLRVEGILGPRHREGGEGNVVGEIHSRALDGQGGKNLRSAGGNG